MFKFGNRSKKLLETCHSDIVKVMNMAIKYFDFSVLEGARSDEAQLEHFLQGRSRCDGVEKKSSHQVTRDKPLSDAIDIAPYPIDWEDKERFYFLAGIIKFCSEYLHEQGEISAPLTWGGDWNNNNNFEDQKFFDLPHYERNKKC